MAVDIGIDPFPAHGETDDEQAEDLEETMAGHEFPHPLHGPHVQELQDFAVTPGIGEPGAEVGLRDAVEAAEAPLLPLQRKKRWIRPMQRSTVIRR